MDSIINEEKIKDLNPDTAVIWTGTGKFITIPGDYDNFSQFFIDLVFSRKVKKSDLEEMFENVNSQYEIEDFCKDYVEDEYLVEFVS